MTEYLFVYGTLRKNYRLALTKKLANDWTYLATGKIDALLYDLGKYPGAVKSNRGEVIGDCYRLDNPEKVLGILDTYEGIPDNQPGQGEFIRQKATVKLRTGTNVRAWVYWYNRDPGTKKPLRYKDYLNYLKNKSTI